MTKTLSRPRKIAAVLAAAVVTAAGSVLQLVERQEVYVVGYSVPAPAYTAVGTPWPKDFGRQGRISLSPDPRHRQACSAPGAAFKVRRLRWSSKLTLAGAEAPTWLAEHSADVLAGRSLGEGVTDRGVRGSGTE